ncbi:DUF1636 domain-containing protein [Parasedimentitalea psychrophila]|uniref:DUF1636 domain-containing protein n=1 Tax=Parasedimentitalea psychrophila TaxID=2997337 RepID=A0A9Y2P3K6_9RHOB|nr:DUF1636 domain-containing protein [Parasedimentitalea psychrophila]WIY24374.1 DUF1636 domain-containing protein [Parasedimentitalea psychrophila]
MGSPTHKITICTSCKHKGTQCRPGYELIAQLQAAISAAGDAVSEEFGVSGVAYMAGCERPCTVAYHGTRKATFLFGDIAPDEDIDDLVVFARQYAEQGDGWYSSVDRPGKLRNCTLARVPAAIIALEYSAVRLS